MMRIGILASHPIQYQAPWFRGLAQVADVSVFFAHRQTAKEQGDAGFGVAFDWDVDLFAGYRHQFLRNVSRAPSVNLFAGCDTPEIAEIIRREKFDAFIVNGWYLKSFLQAAHSCRRAHTPVFIRGDSQLGTSQPHVKRLLKEVTHRLLLRRFDGFLYVGKRNAEYLEYYGASPDRMFFVPHFVDNKRFSGAAAAAFARRTELRASWGASEKTVVALFVGKLAPHKRASDLLHALHQTDRDEYVAIFVGSGESERSLRREAEALGVTAYFEGFKNQSELPLYYTSADAVVLPSSETWGLVVNEGMACGRPAIVSNAAGCLPDLIDEGQTGFSFPLGNTGALLDRIRKVADKKSNGYDWRPALASKLAIYSLEKAVEGTMNAIDTLRLKRKVS